jgi:hypothetical protein
MRLQCPQRKLRFGRILKENSVSALGDFVLHSRLPDGGCPHDEALIHKTARSAVDTYLLQALDDLKEEGVQDTYTYTLTIGDMPTAQLAPRTPSFTIEDVLERFSQPTMGRRGRYADDDEEEDDFDDDLEDDDDFDDDFEDDDFDEDDDDFEEDDDFDDDEEELFNQHRPVIVAEQFEGTLVPSLFAA